MLDWRASHHGKTPTSQQPVFSFRTCPAGPWGRLWWTLWMCAAGVEMVPLFSIFQIVQIFRFLCCFNALTLIFPSSSVPGPAGSRRPLPPAVLQPAPWRQWGGWKRRWREQRQTPDSLSGESNHQWEPSAHLLLKSWYYGLSLSFVFGVFILMEVSSCTMSQNCVSVFKDDLVYWINSISALFCIYLIYIND